MTVYETICIIKTSLTDEELGKVITKVRGFIEKSGGEILKMENWGKKKMAYEVRKEKKGAYVFFRFRGPSPVVAELERQYRLEDSIIKFLTIKCDPKLLAEEMTRESAAAVHAASPAPVAVAVAAASPDSTVGG
ncbi:MAG: 30S ribosomal protein S6 [Nitrospirae bacterium]|nr:30S ribosomal protein S6 [Nitrospirota bacterium]